MGWHGWTTREEEVLREWCHLGAEGVQMALLRECGSQHTIRAIESHASRIHVSLRVRQTCPECGEVGVRLNRQSGMCPHCTELMHLNEEIAYNELLMREREEIATEEQREELARDRAAMRQRNSRLRRKWGLKGRKGER